MLCHQVMHIQHHLLLHCAHAAGLHAAPHEARVRLGVRLASAVQVVPDALRRGLLPIGMGLVRAPGCGHMKQDTWPVTMHGISCSARWMLHPNTCLYMVVTTWSNTWRLQLVVRVSGCLTRPTGTWEAPALHLHQGVGHSPIPTT